jgi:hypothetical protein
MWRWASALRLVKRDVVIRIGEGSADGPVSILSCAARPSAGAAARRDPENGSGLSKL